MTSTVFISFGFTVTYTLSLFSNWCVEAVDTVTVFCVIVPVRRLSGVTFKLWELPTPTFTIYRVYGTAVLSTPT